MRPFSLHHASNPVDAIRTVQLRSAPADTPPTQAPGQFIAGGTTILDLMKLDVMRPEVLINIAASSDQRRIPNQIEVTEAGIRFGAGVKMAEAAEHPEVLRNYPVIAESLQQAASQQIRNMASLGGNMLQRTRCAYFRDTSYRECNKRDPGSGCAALQGYNRLHAVLGVSDSCIAWYPGDFAQALMALDAEIDITGSGGDRTLPFAELHQLPGDTPHIETTLAPGELITSIFVPAGGWTRRSLYLKIRDRESYAFALASVALAIELADDTVQAARIALGGLATVPWRARAAEESLQGGPLNEETASAAAEAAFAEAVTAEHNAYKVPLGQQTLIRALLEAGRMEVAA